MNFDGDDEKNTENKRKHGLSFEQVVPLFSQDHELEFDADHSTEEERWTVRGCLAGLGEVMVVHTEETENEIRIISARIEQR